MSDPIQHLREALVANDLEKARTLIGSVWHEREALRRKLDASQRCDRSATEAGDPNTGGNGSLMPSFGRDALIQRLYDAFEDVGLYNPNRDKVESVYEDVVEPLRRELDEVAAEAKLLREICRTNGWPDLAAEPQVNPSEAKNLEDRLRRERDHWKAAHDSAVESLRLLTEDVARAGLLAEGEESREVEPCGVRDRLYVYVCDKTKGHDGKHHQSNTGFWWAGGGS